MTKKSAYLDVCLCIPDPSDPNNKILFESDLSSIELVREFLLNKDVLAPRFETEPGYRELSNRAPGSLSTGQSLAIVMAISWPWLGHIMAIARPYLGNRMAIS